MHIKYTQRRWTWRSDIDIEEGIDTNSDVQDIEPGACLESRPVTRY